MVDGTHMMFGFGWIFWILLLLGGAWLVARVSGRTGAASSDPTARPETPRTDAPRTDASSESPLDTLQRRYARGELSTEEYEERKKHLERDR